ncbi:MAG: SDR family NAD(P)-dependent oxidoreductase [Clostridia bacterium]|nr:SDR family NAD(P)-dependent oxidoreductase [Clostridia bacterium]
MAKLNLKSKNVIISGVSSGIGKEIARLLIEKYDCKIFGIARDEQKILSFVKELKKPELLSDYTLFDVANEQSWKDFSNLLIEKNFVPDLLINCAGILPKFSNFARCKTSDVKRVFDVNFFSCVYSTKHLLPLLEKSGFPSIVNVSSSSALVDFAGITGYASSKSALKSFTLCLASEMGKKGYVGCICPGFSNTDIYRSQSASSKDLKLIKKFSTSPEKVAKKTVKAIIKKKKLKIIGYDAKLMNFFYKLMPKTTSKVITAFLKKSGLEIFKEL